MSLALLQHAPLNEADVKQLQRALRALFRALREDFRRELARRRHLVSLGLGEPVSKAQAPGDARNAFRAAAHGRWTSQAAQTLAAGRLKLAMAGAKSTARKVGGDVTIIDGGKAMSVAMRGRTTRIRVLDHLRAQGAREAHRLADKLERDVQSAFGYAIERGADLAGAEAAALRIFDGLEDWQAERLARDQLAKATKEGRQAFASGFGDLFVRRWMATAGEVGGDGRNRESHLAMHGKIVGVNEPWIVNYSLDRDSYPGAVPEMNPGDSRFGIQCLLPDMRVRGRAVAALRSWYEGRVVEVRTLNGHALSVTPNHPVLTTRGWIPAGELAEGDGLVSDARWVQQPLGGSADEDDKDAPPRIEDVFNMLSLVGLTREPLRGVDLHGDAERGNGYVEVAGAARLLHHRLEPQALQGLGDLGLPHALARTGPLVREGALHHLLAGPHADASGDVRGAHLALDRSGALRFDGAPLDTLGLGLTTQLDAALSKAPRERYSVAADLMRELVDALPGDVARDQVVELRDYVYSGHVYDLVTPAGYYLAGPAVRNCRCDFDLIEKDEKLRDQDM